MEKGTWWATVHGVAKSWTWLSDSHFHFFQGKICKIDTEGKGEQCRGRKVTLMTTKGKKSVLQPHTSPWVSTDDACLMNTIDPWERATLLINQSTPRSLLCFGVSPHWQTQVGQGWSQKTSPSALRSWAQLSGSSDSRAQTKGLPWRSSVWLWVSNAGGIGLIPGQGSKVPFAMWQNK